MTLWYLNGEKSHKWCRNYEIQLQHCCFMFARIHKSVEGHGHWLKQDKVEKKTKNDCTRYCSICTYSNLVKDKHL